MERRVAMFESGPTPLPFLRGLAGNRDSQTRSLVLRIAVDQFMARDAHAPAAIRRFENEVRPLIEECNAAARTNAARKLCAHATPPLRILEFVAELGGGAEIVVLTNARFLSRKRLEAAASGEPAKALALASRGDLDGELVAALADRNERAIALALARNPAAPLDSRIIARWTPTAERDPELAQALLARIAPSLDQAPLFFVALPEQRLALLAAAQRAELAQPRAAATPRGSREATALLESLALSEQNDLFVAALSLALRCPESLARKLTDDPSGEALAIALAALEMPRDATVRILVSGDLRSGAGFKRVAALARLKDAVSPAAAQRFIGAMSGPQAASRTRHAPQFDPTASPTPGRTFPLSAPASARQTPPIAALGVKSA
jgi:uncharacterized protein (DUF2336 family)